VTHRLYYTDSYLRDFSAAVIGHTDDATRIYLDQTAFYPTSGGQAFDTGELSGVRVIDVVEEGERIAHLMAAPLLDQRVVGRIDWPRRFDHMQQHTGQHLLSAVLADLVGRMTLSVHFGKESSTVDLDGGPLTPAELCRVEAQANQVVSENRLVKVEFQDASAAEGLRKPSGRQGRLRIVSIQNLDRSACGGTHVRATGEIGPILLRKVERVRTGMRVEFVCGGRAIRHARADYDVLTRLAAQLTVSPAEVPQVLEGLRADLKSLRSESQELQGELDRLRGGELYSKTEPGSDGIRRVVCRTGTGPVERLKGLAQAVASMPLALFVGATTQPPALIVAASRDSGMDAGKVLKSLLAGVGGRGGGSAVLAQGTVPNAAQLESVIGSVLQVSESKTM
jgi:alanyl-tRNA synthetase